MKSKFLVLSYILNLIFLFLFIVGAIVWADTNGIWHDAKDVRGGFFGADEQDVTASMGYTFMNRVNFNGEVNYMGVELNASFVNENQANSINSNMIIDNTISENDINFNYANSSSKGGSAINSNSCNGDEICEMKNATISGQLTVNSIKTSSGSNIVIQFG